MKYAYSIDEERMIAERSEMVVRGLTLGTVSDNEATKNSPRRSPMCNAGELFLIYGVSK